MTNHSDWYQRRIDPDHERFADFDTPADRRAAELARDHAGTPAQVFLDSLGRQVISVAHNRRRDEDGALVDEKHATFTRLDAEGKPLWVRDARRNLVMQYIAPQKPTRAAGEPDPENAEATPDGTMPCYDIAGTLLFQHSMDAGDRWMLPDATGEPFYAWDLNDRVHDDGTDTLEHRTLRTIRDEFRRPVEQQLRINDGPWQVVERLAYRDPAPASDSPDPEAARLNLGGQIYRHWDQSGLRTNLSLRLQRPTSRKKNAASSPITIPQSSIG